MSPVVLAQHVTKWYGPRRAVSDVSFAVEPGEILGLLGPNGSGGLVTSATGFKHRRSVP